MEIGVAILFRKVVTSSGYTVSTTIDGIHARTQGALVFIHRSASAFREGV